MTKDNLDPVGNIAHELLRLVIRKPNFILKDIEEVLTRSYDWQNVHQNARTLNKLRIWARSEINAMSNAKQNFDSNKITHSEIDARAGSAEVVLKILEGLL